MKVKCINNPKPYEALTVGKEYVVLAIEFYDKTEFSKFLGDFVVYRLKSDDGVVIPFPSNLFEITLNRLPSSWVSYRRNNEAYSILPRTWARDYFWDDYYNDNADVIQAFRTEEKLILSEA